MKWILQMHGTGGPGSSNNTGTDPELEKIVQNFVDQLSSKGYDVSNVTYARSENVRELSLSRH